MNIKPLQFSVTVSLIFLCSCRADKGVELRADPSHSSELLSASAKNQRGKEGLPTVDAPFLRSEDPSLIARDNAECNAWKYPEARFVSDFKDMKEITQETWGRQCYQYACSYSGKKSIDGQEYFIEVNAGGWVKTVDSKNHVRFYATASKSKSFLATCDCCEGSRD